MATPIAHTVQVIPLCWYISALLSVCWKSQSGMVFIFPLEVLDTSTEDQRSAQHL